MNLRGIAAFVAWVSIAAVSVAAPKSAPLPPVDIPYE